MVVGTAYLSYRFARLRPLLEGEPVDAHRRRAACSSATCARERMTVQEIAAEARLQGIGALEEIRYAVLETNGKISFFQQN